MSSTLKYITNKNNLNYITGFSNIPNKAGIRYYQKLIAGLKANNIEPVITMYHWDLPQAIQDTGGFPNSNIIDWFTNYARTCFEHFGNSVKYWLTFNEPKEICRLGYGAGYLAPFIKSKEQELRCTHNVILAHAKVFHLYNESYRDTQKGLLILMLI